MSRLERVYIRTAVGAVLLLTAQVGCRRQTQTQTPTPAATTAEASTSLPLPLPPDATLWDPAAEPNLVAQVSRDEPLQPPAQKTVAEVERFASPRTRRSMPKLAAKDPSDPRSPTPINERIALIRAKYASTAQYADRGSLRELRGASESLASFVTRLDRLTGRFMIQFIQRDRSYAIVRNGDGETSVHDSYAQEPQPRDDLTSALQVAKRLTKSTTVISPALLLPNEMPRSAFWDALKSWETRDDQPVNGVNCQRFRANYYDDQAHVELWVDADLAIRRIALSEPRLNREVRWEFTPTFERPLPQDAFRPVPPDGAVNRVE